MPDIKFYDTNALILAGDRILEDQQFLISSITLKELENIKSSSNKDVDIKYNARYILHLLNENPDKYQVVCHKESNRSLIRFSLDGFDYHSNDMKILSDALESNDKSYADRIIFVTNDLCLKNIANLYLGDKNIISVTEEYDPYTGYKEVEVNDDILAEFYQDPTVNYFDLLVGEYLILRQNGEIIDVRAWTGDDHRYISNEVFDSKWFGKVTPYKNDIYQKLLFDSLVNNRITMIKGLPGSGKTQVALSFLMSQLDHNKIDKIVLFCNTVATANSAKLGFYPGTKDQKLLDSQIGNLLISKFGGQDAVNQLINEEKIVLLPFSDIRGYDTTGMQAGVYITEAQNLDTSLMKLALQRIGEDCICIIDGDEKSQVDMKIYSGHNNGMRRVSKVFRGHDIYGEVCLKNIYRSEIAKIAEEL